MVLEMQMEKFLNGGGCSCNYEPIFSNYNPKREHGFVTFYSEQIYNAFMIQMALCTLDNINAPTDSVTYKVRDGLQYTQDDIKWARAHMRILVDNFHKFQGGPAADSYTPGVGVSRGWWIEHKKNVHAQFFSLYQIDKIEIPRVKVKKDNLKNDLNYALAQQPISINNDTSLTYETDHDLPARFNAQAFGIPAAS